MKKANLVNQEHDSRSAIRREKHEVLKFDFDFEIQITKRRI